MDNRGTSCPTPAERPRPWRTARTLVAALALAACLVVAALGLTGCSDLAQLADSLGVKTSTGASAGSTASEGAESGSASSGGSVSRASADVEAFLAEIPAYSGEVYVVLDDNEPGFTAEDATTIAFESYSPLDELDRCGVAYACLGLETLPTEERGDIHEIHPTGWHRDTYDFIEGELLYNRSHLIAFQLSGENANERNLITGTRFFNAEGMLPFEEMVGDYIRQTGNHVLYRVTPVFVGEELVARGAQMEALSMEDGGAGVRFNVYIYNVQPGVEIDYLTGDNWLASETGDDAGDAAPAQNYVLNVNSRRFHEPDCPSVADISPENRDEVYMSRDELVEMGYEPCGACRP